MMRCKVNVLVGCFQIMKAVQFRDWVFNKGCFKEVQFTVEPQSMQKVVCELYRNVPHSDQM